MTDQYDAIGYSQISVGFGKRPAILVVDFQMGFTDASLTMGGSPLVDSAVENTARLLASARERKIPVIQTYVAHTQGSEALRWKIPAVVEEFGEGAPATKLDPRIYDPDYDILVRKIAPSILFQTPAIQVLGRHNIDTTIIVGCNTSGCVRASIVDAFSYGFRVIVPRECCGDVEEGPHNDNLRDVGRRYADVVSLNEVMMALPAAAPEPA
ncbi:MAG: isochorismatase family protein [Pseudomonadota bacterium]